MIASISPPNLLLSNWVRPFFMIQPLLSEASEALFARTYSVPVASEAYSGVMALVATPTIR